MVSKRKYSLLPAVKICQMMNLDLGRILHRASLSPAVLNVENVNVSPDVIFRCFEAAAIESGRTDFFFELGKYSAQVPVGPAYFAFQVSSDFGSAIQLVSKYKLEVAPIGWSVKKLQGGLNLEIYTALPEFPIDSNVALMEFIWLLTLQRSCCLEAVVPRKVTIVQEVLNLNLYEEYFGCPIELGERNLIEFDAASITMKLHSADHYVHEVLVNVLDANLANSEHNDAVTHLAERVIRDELKRGKTELADVAKQLGMSLRSLQRRLNDEGTTLKELQNRVRREMAGDLILNTSYGISEVSLRLGYRDPAAFFKAFSKWYACTPAQMRARRS